MSNKYGEKEWRDAYKKGGHGTCDSPQWLLNGCPKCGHKEWEVTNDNWAYCKGCSIGIHTDYPFTSSGKIIDILKPNK